MNKLLVKNLPSEFSDADKYDFLKLFGASEVVSFPVNSKMKGCCFVSFPDNVTAKQALDALHQFEILGKRLIAEFSKPAHIKSANHQESKIILERKDFLSESSKEKATSNKKDNEKIEEINNVGINPKLNVNHDFPNHLMYKYPDPNILTLTNIANALACVPKFYIQVLNLMNKMNLPPPFSNVTVTPPLPGDSILLCDACVDTSDLKEFMSSDESELESDVESNKKHEIYKGNTVTVEPLRKRKRLRTVAKVNQEKLNTVAKSKNTETVENTFEFGSSSKRFEFKLAASIKEAVEGKSQPVVSYNVFDERGEFGKIQPATKEVLSSDEEEEEEEEEEDIESQDFISASQLKDNRIAQKDILLMAQFKKYSPGERTNRLYVKNLSKQVVEDDLKYIFKRYIKDCTDVLKASMEIRLMQEGRMKGQAFVTLPSEEIAERALKQVHGYILHEKPMVIQYGRSGKGK